MKKSDSVYRVILPIIIATSLVVSGCSSPFNSKQELEIVNDVKLLAQDNNKVFDSKEVSSNDEIKMASLAPISEMDSTDGTMRIMQQSLFRPSLKVKEEISQTVVDYLNQVGNIDFKSITGEEGLELLHPDTRLEVKEKTSELVKRFYAHELSYEVKDLEAELVLETPMGARARVKGTISRQGKDVSSIYDKPFLAFFDLKEYGGKWYIEKAPDLDFLSEMNVLPETEVQQIKEVLHEFVYATFHWDYHTVTGKEGFEYLAPPLFNENVLNKIAAENVKRYQENEWVQIVNMMMVYFVYGTTDNAHATVVGSIDRSGKDIEHRDNPFEVQYQLKKVDGKWLIANILKYEG